MDYTTLSLAQVLAGLDAVATDTQATFGRLDARRLNWRPDGARWSVAQCFDHLLAANRLMVQAAQRALDGAKPRIITYSVLDGARLMLAHDHRHIQQAGRVTRSPGFDL